MCSTPHWNTISQQSSWKTIKPGLLVGHSFDNIQLKTIKWKTVWTRMVKNSRKKSQLKLGSFWRLVAHSWRRTVVSSLLFQRWNIADSLKGKLGKNGLISMQPHITPLQGFLSTQNVRHLCKEKSAINTAIGGTLLEASTTMKGATLFKKISTCRDDFWPGSAHLCNLW